MAKGWFFGVLPRGGQEACRELGREREREREIRRMIKKGWVRGERGGADKGRWSWESKQAMGSFNA